MSIAKLEDRIVSLEQKVNDLARKVAGASSKDVNAWIDKIHGTFKNDAAYRQAARFGRDWRTSHRPGRFRLNDHPGYGRLQFSGTA